MPTILLLFIKYRLNLITKKQIMKRLFTVLITLLIAILFFPSTLSAQNNEFLWLKISKQKANQGTVIKGKSEPRNANFYQLNLMFRFSVHSWAGQGAWRRDSQPRLESNEGHPIQWSTLHPPHERQQPGLHAHGQAAIRYWLPWRLLQPLRPLGGQSTVWN